MDQGKKFSKVSSTNFTWYILEYFVPLEGLSWHLNIGKLKIWLKNEKNFQSEIKTIFVSQVLSFRLTKQTSKNVADTTFNWRVIKYQKAI